MSRAYRVPQRQRGRGRGAGSDGPQVIRLRLFVAGRSLRRSRAAQAAIEDLVDWLRPRPCEFEVVDVLDDPQMASFHRVVITPAVDRLVPPPAHRIVGDMPRPERLASRLGLRVRLSR